MRLLVLGGTVFLGHAVAAHARDAGHSVTCLARGSSGSVPDGVELVRADRSDPAAYDDVADQDWDAVVEVSWQPGQVRAALAALAPRTAHWTYVSSCSAYADQGTPRADETAALLEPLAPDVDAADVEQYGQAKVACEEACRAAVGDRLHVSRAGLLAGPGDRSDRVGYWPGRFARGGDVLVPDNDGWAQMLDVRDLAAFLVRGAETRLVATLNAVGDIRSLRDVIGEAQQVAGTECAVVAADDAWLLEQGIEPYMGPESLPLWLPLPEYAGFSTRSDEAVVAAGLVRRPVVETLAAALVDERRLGLDRSGRRAGLSPAREAELVAAWRTRG